MPVTRKILSDVIKKPLHLLLECDKSNRKGIPTARRLQVIALSREGLRNRAIAARAGVSVGSVSNILRAVGAHSDGIHVAKKPEKRTLRSKARNSPGTKNVEETPHTVAKRYKLPTAIVEQIKKEAPLYGSQGRALQLATELLVRLVKPLKLEPPKGNGAVITGMTYKLTPRTAELIDRLVEQYGTRGNVLAACAQILAAGERMRVTRINPAD